MAEKSFKYKLDFYYLQTVIYLITFLLYGALRGTIAEDRFTIVFHDPIVYLIGLFCAVALGTLILNLVRGRRLIVEDDRIIFHSRFRERVIRTADIEWAHVGRERLVQTSGRFQLVLLKVKGQRMLYRIRIGRYERERELVAEMERLTARLPHRKRVSFGRRHPVQKDGL